ncbi:MAG: hypothetical protein Q9190_001207 [Brigantiaea leucoxantha]
MPPKAPKAKEKHKQPLEEKREESLQAVVRTLLRLQRSMPPAIDKCGLAGAGRFCLLPLANTPLIEYTLEFLAHAGVRDIFIYCGLHTDQLESYINSSKWKSTSSPFQTLTLLKSDATSVGDAMRDLDNRDLITGDFVLVSGDVISNIAIEPVLSQHRARRAKDKNAIMTMVLREAGVEHRTKSRGRRPIFVIDPDAERCLHYEELRSKETDDRFINLDPDLLSSHAELEIRADLIDCYIDICTPDVLSLWSDNFDYQSVRTSFLFGVLKDYELNGKTIHTYIVADEYASRVKSLRAYSAVSKDVIDRWAYPLCPDSNLVKGQTYRHQRGNVYKEDGVVLARNCRVNNGCVVGEGTSIGDGSVVTDSVLGRRCRIGKNSNIKGAYLWDDATVGDGSEINGAIIAEGVIVGNNCIIEPGALISYGARIADSTTVKGIRRITRIRGSQDSSPRPDPTVVGEGGEGYDYAADSDGDSNGSTASANLVYSNPDLSLSISSISTLASTRSDSEALPDTSRRESFVSETSDEAVPNKDFHVEATASVLDGLQKDDLPENIFLELNALRMTMDVSQHAIRRAIVAAFVKRIANLEAAGIGARESVHKVLSKYKAVVERTIFDKESEQKPDQVDFLMLMQEQLVGKTNGKNLMLFTAKELYDLEAIEEDGILQWWNDKRSGDGEMAEVRSLTEQFVTFLEEAEEDDDESDESANEG